MSSYTKTTNFTAKDSLPTGDASKLVLGSELDTEFSAIATAVNSKLDSSGYVATPFEPVESVNLSGGGTSTGICLFSETPAAGYTYKIVLRGVSVDTADTFLGLEVSSSSTWRTTAGQYAYNGSSLGVVFNQAAGTSAATIHLLSYTGFTGIAAAYVLSGEITIYNAQDSGVQTIVDYRINGSAGSASYGFWIGGGTRVAAETQDAFRLRLYTDFPGTTDGRDFDAGSAYLYKVSDT